MTSRLIVLAVATLTFFASCTNLFMGNFFEEFDGPPDASELLGSYTSSDGTVSTSKAPKFVGAVSEAAESSKFYKDLSSSDRTELNTALKSVYDDASVDTATRQSASVLAAEVKIRDTGAGETINNVANVLTSDLGADSFNDPEALMDLIIPDSAKGDATAVKKILDDLVSAGDAYDNLGSIMTDEDGDGTVDGPSGVNMTETAQKAAVAIAVMKLADPDGDGVTDTATLSNEIINKSFSADTESALDNFPGDTTNLENILDAGGLGGLFDGL